ncbi:hypothetical protein SNE510_08510 [Streptomyces sp. NE5-10]|nr:hypothetical protein SNE510_08510 [Streptomyces sp. NE5-10]
MPCALAAVFATRSPTTAGSTVTAPAGAVAGPAGGASHTRATAPFAPTGPAAAPGPGAGAVPAGAAGVPVQPVAASRSSTRGAAGTVRRRRSLTTRPPSRGT